MNPKSTLSILGGGPAGLAVGYYAQKQQQDFQIFEAEKNVGGHCVTFEHHDFKYDSGAHRFHDKDPEITREVKQLLGKQLLKVQAPSQVFHNKQLIDFPLSPVDLLKKIGAPAFIKAGLQVLQKRMTLNKKPPSNFQDFAVNTYGQDIADRFLINYSKKLWGAPCSELSPVIAGNRMKGLNLKTVILESIWGQRAKTHHLEGAFFYYPKNGFGEITSALEKSCGSKNISTESRITRVIWDKNRITNIEINKDTLIPTEQVVNTLPVSLLLNLMDPKPPSHILKAAEKLRFRDMILIFIALDMPAITNNATLYFPDADCIFTRAYEPRNRSRYMSPPGKTSLVLEIPCQRDSQLWQSSASELVQKAVDQLVQYDFIQKKDILHSQVKRMYNTYPILLKNHEKEVKIILDYLSIFENLDSSGRNGLFTYTHLHDMMRFGKTIIEKHHPSASL